MAGGFVSRNRSSPQSCEPILSEFGSRYFRHTVSNSIRPPSFGGRSRCDSFDKTSFRFKFRRSVRGTMRRSRLMVSVAIGAAVVGMKAASATDLPAPVYTKAPVKVDPAYDWSGFYLGVHAGYIWGRSRVFDDGVLTESGAPTDGFVGGLLAGYNRQSGPFVLGLEGDFGWSNAKGSGIISPPPPPPPPPAPPPAPPPPAPLPRGPNAYHLMWDSHVVGKVGFTSDRWLLFATGEFAIAGFNFQEGVPPGRPPSNWYSCNLCGLFGRRRR